MPYKKKTAKRAKAAISENVRQYLLTGERENSDAEVFRLSGSRDRLQKVWDAVKNEITRDWTKQYPASRPMLWWKYDAPKEPVRCHADMDIEEAQRKRLAGKGTPSFEVLAYMPHFDFGIPLSYVNQWECDYYNGRAKDIHGKRIKSGFKKGDFKAVAYNKEDPPCYEAVATFLQRHKLLSESEQIYLKQNPKLLDPEKVIFDDDQED